MNIGSMLLRTLAGAIILGTGLVTIIGSGGGGIEGPFDYFGPAEPIPPPGDNPPTAIAGPDQSVTEGDVVTLQGSGYDDEGPVTFHWRQESGPEVSLSDANRPRPTLIAPPVAEPTELQFRLRVFDSKGQVGANGIDYTSVFVAPSAQPPKFVLLDFETLPDGSLPIEFEPVDSSYLAECVIFRNFEPVDTSKSPEYRRFLAENTVVWDNDRVFNPPPETTFNVTVDFTVPVVSMKADVYVEAGASVTLQAFDEAGQQLGSITSAVSTECCELKADTVSLASTGWIHQITFESSAPQTNAPAIDNLEFERRTACE